MRLTSDTGFHPQLCDNTYFLVPPKPQRPRTPEDGKRATARGRGADEGRREALWLLISLPTDGQVVVNPLNCRVPSIESPRSIH